MKFLQVCIFYRFAFSAALHFLQTCILYRLAYPDFTRRRVVLSAWQVHVVALLIKTLGSSKLKPLSMHRLELLTKAIAATRTERAVAHPTAYPGDPHKEPPVHAGCYVVDFLEPRHTRPMSLLSKLARADITC